jgi:diguanylate cyclase (GGDEF)-like protein
MSDGSKVSRPPLVLIAGDQEWAARSLETILGTHGYAVLRAYTGRQALDLARSAQPDVLVLDARLPDMDGIEICRTLRADPHLTATTPIIVTASGPAGRAQRLAAYQAGAWEFCTQPLDAEVLLLKLDTFMRSKREVDQVREESLLDQVTGLYNMRGLARRAREIGAEAFRRHDPLACVAFAPDVSVLDESEPALNEVGIRMAEHLGAVFRRTGRLSDAIGRLGQAEFAVVAPATRATGARRIVERLRESIEASPITVSGRARRLRLRAGYYAVPDFAQSSIDAVEMIVRATAR